MKLAKRIGVLAVVIGLSGIATIATAAVTEIEIRTAPPPDRVENLPPPREGYLYEQGHYTYDGRQYVWSDGQFLKHREGHTYTPYALERRGDTWYYRPGYWDDNQK